MRAPGRREAVHAGPARAVREVLAATAPGQDAPDRVRPLCGRPAGGARSGQAGDVRLSGLYAHLREDSGRAVLAAAHHGLEADAGEAERGQGPAQATPARASPRARTVAGQRGTGPPGLLRGTRQRPGGSILPETGDQALASGATQSQPAPPPELGPDEPPGDTMATTRPHPASLPRRTLRRSYPRQEPSALARISTQEVGRNLDGPDRGGKLG